MKYKQDEMVKTCRRLESGLRFGPEGLGACQFGAIAAPVYWTGEEAGKLVITKDMIIEKRKWLLDALNDNTSDISCKQCEMVELKPYREINLTQLGQIDFATSSICNLRCNFCGFTQHNNFTKAKFDDLSILREFDVDDVQWDAVVDFNGGEPVLLKNLREYIDYFISRRIRIRFMTNGTIFSQEVYDGLVDGTMQWVCTSVDAGTPSTYLKKKERDLYGQVLENLTRYAHAGRQGGGMLAMKYIFCDDNCGDDDIYGFVYAALAIRPHQVWLTFDFSPFGSDYDYAREIEAYVKMYGLFKRHGIQPVHYSVGHLALISKKGQTLLETVQQKIAEADLNNPRLQHLESGYHPEIKSLPPDVKILKQAPLEVVAENQEMATVDFSGKKILLTPPGDAAFRLMDDPDFEPRGVCGFLDRDPMIQGKKIKDIPIVGYPEIPALQPDIVIVAAPEQHRIDIVNQLSEYKDQVEEVFLLT